MNIGNKTGITHGENFCQVFRDMRTPYNKAFDMPGCMVNKDSASALWILQLAQQTKLLRDPSGKRVHFMDNFYTRHVLAETLKTITDGEARVIGTVKYTNVDGINRLHLSQGVQRMKDKEHGQWCLVKACNQTNVLLAAKKKHEAAEKKKPAADRVAFELPEDSAATNAGYIIWKDCKVVTFYTNDLLRTPKKWITDGTEEDAIECVHGLECLERWMGDEFLHRTQMMVPATIVAYNMYMNSVDRMDQR